MSLLSSSFVPLQSFIIFIVTLVNPHQKRLSQTKAKTFFYLYFFLFSRSSLIPYVSFFFKYFLLFFSVPIFPWYSVPDNNTTPISSSSSYFGRLDSDRWRHSSAIQQQPNQMRHHLKVDLRHLDEVEGSNIVDIGMDLSEFYMSVEWDILEVPAVR